MPASVASSSSATDDRHTVHRDGRDGRGHGHRRARRVGAPSASIRGRPVAHLSVGNPHTVVAVDDLDAVDLAALGAAAARTSTSRSSPPAPTPTSITMRVHERGVGITEACGTGACAAAVAAVRWGLAAPADGKLVVHMDGGRASVGSTTTAPA